MTTSGTVRYRTRCEMVKIIVYLAIIVLVAVPPGTQADDGVNIKEVRRLAKLPVNEILQNSPVEIISIEHYWLKVRGRTKPLVVFFYADIDSDSQRLATLIKYITPHYQAKLSFARVQVSDKGKPDKNTASGLRSRYSLDKTPGILYYDNVAEKMVLEDEDYLEADFKEFRTPKMFIWKTYYSGVRKELDKLLSD